MLRVRWLTQRTPQFFKNRLKWQLRRLTTLSDSVWAGIGAYRIPSESTVEKINVARALNTEGFILFSYDFTARPSELNPEGAYLERIRRAAF